VLMNFERETGVGVWIDCIRVFVAVSIVMSCKRELFLKVCCLWFLW
jgi:hypothetical protein